jgi:ferritin-like metal-binding protein YciE
MNRSKQKVVQYLKEARASEQALVRVLQSQIAMTPRGDFRQGLEAHLEETRTHAHRLDGRIHELQHGFNPILFAYGIAETVVGQALAIAKTPADLVRGTGGEEKVLKNAKDAAATEALEIATYVALERLATLAEDATTAELAVSIRRDEERMLDRILAAIPGLTEAVYGADVHGDPSYDVTKTGAADAARAGAAAAGEAVDGAKDAAKDAGAGAAKKARAAATKSTKAAKAAAQDAEDAAEDAGEAVAGAAGKATAKAKDAGSAAADAASGTAKKASDAAKDAGEAVAEGAGAAAAKAEDTARDAGAAVADGAASAADAVGDAARATGDAVGNAADEAEAVAEDAKDAVAPDDAPDPDAEKPWAGYDELSVEEVQAVLLTASPDEARAVGEYERAHQARAEIMGVVERHMQTS